MGPKSITALSAEKFDEKSQSVRLLVLYPRTAYRTAFLSYIVDKTDRELVYYRIPDNRSLKASLESLSSYFRDATDDWPQQLPEALQGDDASAWGSAFGADLNTYADGNPICFFLDELDRVPHDDQLSAFMRALVPALSERVQIIVSARLLKYQPWYDFIANEEAVVLGTERREDDIMLTVEERPRPALEVYAFGRGYAMANGQEITQWDGALPRNLFFFFMDNKLVTRDEIFAVFWPNLNTKEATNVFHVTKRKISERITDKVDGPGNYELTQYSAGFYTPSDKVIRHYDVEEFEKSVNKAVAALDDDEEELLLSRAIDLYRGPYLENGKMAWMIERRQQLQQLYAQALIGMGRLHKRRGDDEAALGFFIRSLKETPEREDIHREVMAIYQRAGRIQDAIKQYEHLETRLKADLGIKPSKETRQLFDEIKAQA